MIVASVCCPSTCCAYAAFWHTIWRYQGAHGCGGMQSFGELDPGLQHEFDQYLLQRGVNSDLTNYLVALVNDKEQREYTNWLSRVRTFIS